ncbi:ATP-dependent HslUV protease ATP-binding subunit HslU [Fistulifera solaris]|uniref:ATP-dependent HslUV protease ATP-binding subunit HslU n=1 Tax=Fistulifera solaris TaxID=1519565 RepID=A0A1Z5K1Y8_FISSO|nr:ATP-dependent HslUV protease ATP-binding subunit HslU [Fistulifera solaris]|eukprot:GAX20169.1 ATP-dependent HslUV protease ATP-binding subunit HslU [Fistulifera solaris]
MNVSRLVILVRAPPHRSVLRGFASAVPRYDDSSSAKLAAADPPNPLKVNMKPSEVVAELNRHIVGQADAKRAVAIALRNRWRRQQLPDDLRPEVTPRNVLLVGPTGCGKTEVARRMAQIHDAPFLKVEATKFTEVGYHGRDVDQIIRDLMDVSMQLTKKVWTEKLREQAKVQVEERLLHLLTGPSSKDKSDSARAHDSFRDMLQQGILDDQEIEIDVPLQNNSSDMGGGDTLNPNIVAMSDLWQRVSSAGGGKKQATERKKVPISQAREILLQVELDQLLETVDLKKEAIMAVEESGIVFIDEIDKICSSRDSYRSKSTDASAEGVQRDLLPLIEGTTINTRHGNVKTDYILFIASGAFHTVKPSDMLPELQGRLPIQVELKGLTEEDLYRILTEPVANLVRQQVELLATEGVTLVFEDAAIREMARMAAKLNQTVENIGARRLHTVMERIMEELSFQAAESEGETLTVDVALVQERMSSVTQKLDLSKFIL